MFSLKFIFSPGSMPPDPYFTMHKKAILPHQKAPPPKKKKFKTLQHIIAKKIINDINFHNKKMKCPLPLRALKLSSLTTVHGSFILLLHQVHQVMFA